MLQRRFFFNRCCQSQLHRLSTFHTTTVKSRPFETNTMQKCLVKSVTLSPFLLKVLQQQNLKKIVEKKKQQQLA